MADTIPLVGISTNGGQLKPDGNHLRWFLPAGRSFPSSFCVFRRRAIAPQLINAINLSTLLHPQAPEAQIINRVEVLTDRVRRIELRFTEPVARVQFSLDGPGSGTVNAYRERRPGMFPRYRLLASLPFSGESAGITSVGITRVTLVLESGTPKAAQYASVADTLKTKWDRITCLGVLVGPNTMLARGEGDIANYYVSNEAEFRDNYESTAERILIWLRQLREIAQADHFRNPTTASHLREVFARKPNGVTAALNLQSAFLLAALDPNVARLMSLYYVDAFNKPAAKDVPAPKPTEFYDYKIEGYWPDETLFGLILNLGRSMPILTGGEFPTVDPGEPIPTPSLTGDFDGAQLPGLRWEGTEPRGRVGLRWPRPTKSEDPKWAAVRPVLYELKRRFNNGEDTKLPDRIMIDRLSWGRPFQYVDTNLNLGDYVYTVAPIDVFGQIGPAVVSDKIPVKDTEAPPPPVRTRVSLSPDRDLVALQFEYGASQHQQAPDVGEFKVYWRPDSLSERIRVRVEWQQINTRAGLQRTLRLRPVGGDEFSESELESFVGDVLTNTIARNESGLAADARRRYRIASLDAAGNLVLEEPPAELEPPPEEIPAGEYDLVRDPHDRSTWHLLVSSTVPAQAPIKGPLLTAAMFLSVQAKAISSVAPRPNPFDSVPVENRGPQFPSLPPPDEVVIVEITRFLTEPDVFAGGFAKINSVDTNILSVISSPANPATLVNSTESVSVGSTQIVLPAGTIVEVDDVIELRPPASLEMQVRQLTIAGAVEPKILNRPGGEIAFTREVDERPVTTVMRVISNSVNGNRTFNLLVRADPRADLAALVRDTQLTYYAPYLLTIPLNREFGTLPPTQSQIRLPHEPGTGRRDGFVAVTAKDVRNNEGPLSTAAQFYLIRPKPGRPSVPYPCGLDAQARAGYASPPNRSGRATTCVAWDMNDPENEFRYEVARALDNSVLAVHLREWQKGNPDVTVSAPLIAGRTLKGEVRFDPPGTQITAKFTPTEGSAAAATFRNGRLVINAATNADIEEVVAQGRPRKFFQVTAAQEKDGIFELVLRGDATQLTTSTASATIAAPPDYSAVAGNYEAIRTLAAQTPDAFSLATGMPVSERSFRDEVPGRGRNAFFYRVRTVDAAENRSEWSLISAPFHQVDTTPPEAPLIIKALTGERQVTLSWLRHTDSRVTKYRINRSLTTTLPAGAAVSSAQFEISAGTDPEIEWVNKPVEGTVGDERCNYRVTAIGQVKSGPAELNVIDIASLPSEAVSLSVLDTSLPQPVLWVNAGWDEITDLEPFVFLRWQATETKFVVERSDAAGSLWERLEVGVDRQGDHYVADDRTVDATKSYAYRVRVFNRFGRESTQNPEMRVPALR